MKIDLAIKFGSHEIIIYRKGFGIIAKEPAFLAVTPSGKSFKVKAVGKSAEKLRLTNPNNILIYQPIKNSEIVDEKFAIVLLKEIIKDKVFDKFTVSKINALVAVPCGLGLEQLLRLKKVLLQTGIDNLNFVTNGVCIREYDETIGEYEHCITLDIGKYTTDITVLNKKEIICGRSYTLGGFDMDTALKTYIEDNFELEITDNKAEEIKNKLSTLYLNDTYSTSFRGIDSEKLYKDATITANEVRVAIIGVYDKICELMLNYIKQLPNEMVAELYENGVILSGGGANIQGLYEYLINKLEMPVTILDNANALVIGCAKLLDKPIKSLLKINI